MKKYINIIAIATLAFAVNANAQWNDDGGHSDNDVYQVERQILCESIKHAPAACSTGLDRTQDIYLARQISNAPCVEGQSYSFYRDRINVGNGCRGYFVARGMTFDPLPTDKVIGGGNETPGNPGELVTFKIRCESFDGPVRCRIPLKKVYEAYLYKQLSKNACVEGYSYKINNRFIRVAKGCRATFVVTGTN